MGDGRHPAQGWHVVRRESDGAICCLYTPGDGWWAMVGHNRQGLPSGFSIVAHLDEMIDAWEGITPSAEPRRRAADPRGLPDA